jgi:pimeloyl-ACP methyl ester carboxylesterase
MEDVHAVLDAVSSKEAALIGVSEGGPLSMLLAASHGDPLTSDDKITASALRAQLSGRRRLFT